MKLSEFFDYDPFFRTEEEILGAVQRSSKYAEDDLTGARVTKFFETSKQRTYLVSTGKTVYCVLDDRRKKEPIVSWAESPETLRSITVADRTARTGLINFGPRHNNWLYSKSLFPSGDVVSSVRQLLGEETEV